MYLECERINYPASGPSRKCNEPIRTQYSKQSLVPSVLCGGGAVEVGIVLLFFCLSISWEGKRDARRRRRPATKLQWLRERCCCCCCCCFGPRDGDHGGYVFDYHYDSEDDSLSEGNDIDSE